MGLKGITNEIKGFNSRYDKYFGKTKKPSKPIMFLDYLSSRIIHGANADDYFTYEFYTRNGYSKRRIMTERRLAHLVKAMNGDADVSVLKDKAETNRLFGEYLGREWLDGDTMTIKQLEDFFSRHSEAFTKAKGLRVGRGINIVKADDSVDLIHLFNECRKKHLIIEERVSQTGILHDINPETANTVRIVTVRLGGKTQVVAAAFKCGMGDSVVDHMPVGGLHSVVDVKTGIVISPGTNYEKVPYVFHPITGKQIMGIKLPNWEEAKAMCISASEKIPDIRYVGWDIVISNDSISMIEANAFSGGHSIQMGTQEGVWDEFKTYMKLARAERNGE